MKEVFGFFVAFSLLVGFWAWIGQAGCREDSAFFPSAGGIQVTGAAPSKFNPVWCRK